MFIQHYPFILLYRLNGTILRIGIFLILLPAGNR